MPSGLDASKGFKRKTAGLQTDPLPSLAPGTHHHEEYVNAPALPIKEGN